MNHADDTRPASDREAQKLCPVCGRTFGWRRKWARCWDSVRYCSDACRRGLRPVDDQLEAAVLALVELRGPHQSICPSEAARAVAPDDWHPLVEAARRAVRRLAARGAVEVTQRGRAVDAASARGPIRVRLAGRRVRAC